MSRSKRLGEASDTSPIPMTETPSNRHDDIGTSPRCPTEVIENKPICLCFPCCIRDLSCLDLALLPHASRHVLDRHKFPGGRPPYKSNFYCHPGRAGGTPVLSASRPSPGRGRPFRSRRSANACASATVKVRGGASGFRMIIPSGADADDGAEPWSLFVSRFSVNKTNGRTRFRLRLWPAGRIDFHHEIRQEQRRLRAD